MQFNHIEIEIDRRWGRTASYFDASKFRFVFIPFIPVSFNVVKYVIEKEREEG